VHGVCKVQDDLKSVLSPALKILAPLISLAPKQLWKETATQLWCLQPVAGFGEGGPQLLPLPMPARSPLTQGIGDWQPPLPHTSPSLDLPKEKSKHKPAALIAMDRAKGCPCHPSVSFRAWEVPNSHGERPSDLGAHISLNFIWSFTPLSGSRARAVR